MREPVLDPRRRQVMRVGAGVITGAGLPLGVTTAVAAALDPWTEAEAIAARCSRPLTFRPQDFVITAYGAQPCQTGRVNGFVAYQKKGIVSAPLAGSGTFDGSISA